MDCVTFQKFWLCVQCSVLTTKPQCRVNSSARNCISNHHSKLILKISVINNKTIFIKIERFLVFSEIFLVLVMHIPALPMVQIQSSFNAAVEQVGQMLEGAIDHVGLYKAFLLKKIILVHYKQSFYFGSKVQFLQLSPPKLKYYFDHLCFT